MSVKERISGLSKRDTQFLARAVDLARLSDCAQKHGAIIVRGGRIIGTGINTFRNNPVSNYPSDAYSYHAEIAALNSIKRIRQVGKINAGADGFVGGKIYIGRLSRGGRVSLSRPCDNCMAEILKAGITDIIYTT